MQQPEVAQLDRRSNQQTQMTRLVLQASSPRNRQMHYCLPQIVPLLVVITLMLATQVPVMPSFEQVIRQLLDQQFVELEQLLQHWDLSK